MASQLHFSADNSVLSQFDSGGSIKFWNSKSGSLQQEYIPSSHLSATCTCIAWGPNRRVKQNQTPPKKKRKKEEGEASSSNLVALGTRSGAVQIYSLTKGELEAQLDEGHTDTVHDVRWSSDGKRLFSCSKDCHIAEWNVPKAKLKKRWKGDSRGVYALAVCPDDQHLLTASRKIKLWNIDSHQLLQSFTGHANEVFSLWPLPRAQDTNGNLLESLYFLSAASGDRLINVWQVNTSSKDKTPIASLSLLDQPKQISCTLPSSTNKDHRLAVVTESGDVSIFSCMLNGRKQRPLQPQLTIQVAAAATSGGRAAAQPLPVWAAAFEPARGEYAVSLAYGDLVKPAIETLEYDPKQKHICLTRASSLKAAAAQETTAQKTRAGDTGQEVTVLAPGNLAPAHSATRKRQRSTSVSKEELPIEERLASLDAQSQLSGKEKPRAEHLVVLLSQGLHSGDPTLLNSVLQTRDQHVINVTVRQMPVQVVGPLIKELARRMQGHAQIGLVLSKWIRAILLQHSSYISAFPELVETLTDLQQSIEARAALLSRFSRVQGKLNIMLSQIAREERTEDDGIAGQRALLAYEDDSTSESEDNFPIIDHSEEEDVGGWSDDDEDEEEGDEDDRDVASSDEDAE